MSKPAIIITFLLLALSAGGAMLPASGKTLTISGSGSTSSELLQRAINSASPGDKLLITGRGFTGPIVIDRPLTLKGKNYPILNGDDRGTVVKITASGVSVQGLHIRGSGNSLNQENSAIAIEAPNALISDNIIDDALFGIYLRRAHHTVLQNNTLQGKPLDIPRRGDLIRIWYSRDVTVKNNRIINSRDVVLWYSNGIKVVGNTISNGRYGLHFMYCDDALVKHNRIFNNSVGAFLMYSRRLHLMSNRITGSRGPSGYAVGIKDMDDAIIQGNLFANNRIAIHVDNSPREIESKLEVIENIIAFNDIGVDLLPSARRNLYAQNSFIENNRQVRIYGGGKIHNNSWSNPKGGNYWSDYTGFDLDQDGFGDVPYRSAKVFAELLSRYDKLKLFAYTPAAQAINLAGKLFPSFEPEPELEDPKPLMHPVIPDELPSGPTASPYQTAVAGIGLILASVLLIGYRPKSSEKPADTVAMTKEATIKVDGLTKYYGDFKAVDEVTFTLKTGESIALWGANGAGKTTLIRCILGLLPFSGEITINGIPVHPDNKLTKSLIGFVPQELALYQDLTVQETLSFFADLKKCSTDGILDKVKLSSHADKPVQALSGGLKQRLALGVALLGDPPLLLLDEPTSNLDFQSKEEFLKLLTSLKKEGKTMLFSSHRPEELYLVADRVLVMEQGKIVADTPADELASTLGLKVAIDFCVASETQQKLALTALSKAGFRGECTGNRITVVVDAAEKLKPLKIIFHEGLEIKDLNFHQMKPNETNLRTT